MEHHSASVWFISFLYRKTGVLDGNCIITTTFLKLCQIFNNNLIETHRSYSLWDADLVSGNSLMMTWPIVEYQQEKWHREFSSLIQIYQLIFTARVRSTREGTVFTGVCLFTSGGGVAHPADGGGGGGTPFPGLDGGYSSQIQAGGTPPGKGVPSHLERGYLTTSEGVSPAWEGGTPGRGYHPHPGQIPGRGVPLTRAA